ncbi:MAG: Phosphate uptake regulator PhoU [Candidatus Thermoplasmatota archaeon]|nr:Phosphate uptake regulator PhoU [Candidatus Thermoplasmatota archaeon]
METRKIQKTGGSTYVVSLPKRWVQTSGLKKGDQVALSVTGDGTLTVDPHLPRESEKLVKTVEVTAATESKTLLRQLVGSYVTGYDVIEIRSKGRIPFELRRAVQDFARRVIGPEIVEESANLIVLQDVADHADLDMRKVVRRMHLMAKNMLEESVRAVKELDKGMADEVVSRDDEVDRLHWFVEKQHAMMRRNISFAAKMKTTWLESDSMLLASKALERIADHATRIARSVGLLGDSRVDGDTMRALEQLGEEAVSILDRSVEALFKRDSSLANNCIERTSVLLVKADAFLDETMKKRGRVAVGLAFVIESIERTGGYSSDIAEIAINLAEGQ